MSKKKKGKHKGNKTPKPISAAQLKANRENARKSSGPTTDEGKQAVAQNACNDGLMADKHPVLSWENRTEFDALHREIRLRMAPVGEEEDRVVETIAGIKWRMKRVEHCEAALCRQYWDDQKTLNMELDRLSRKEIRLYRLLDRAYAEFEELQDERESDPELDARIRAEYCACHGLNPEDLPPVCEDEEEDGDGPDAAYANEPGADMEMDADAIRRHNEGMRRSVEADLAAYEARRAARAESSKIRVLGFAPPFTGSANGFVFPNFFNPASPSPEPPSNGHAETTGPAM